MSITPIFFKKTMLLQLQSRLKQPQLAPLQTLATISRDNLNCLAA